MTRTDDEIKATAMLLDRYPLVVERVMFQYCETTPEWPYGFRCWDADTLEPISQKEYEQRIDKTRGY